MVTVTDVLALVESNERICPEPKRWHQLYRLLPQKGRAGPAVPLILGGWWHSTPLQKQERLRGHIEWANKHGVLEAVWNFLISLEESDWIHVNEAPSGHVDFQE